MSGASSILGLPRTLRIGRLRIPVGPMVIRERDLKRFTLLGVHNITGRIPLLSVLQAQRVVFPLIVDELLSSRGVGELRVPGRNPANERRSAGAGLWRGRSIHSLRCVDPSLFQRPLSRGTPRGAYTG